MELLQNRYNDVVNTWYCSFFNECKHCGYWFDFHSEGIYIYFGITKLGVEFRPSYISNLVTRHLLFSLFN